MWRTTKFASAVAAAILVGIGVIAGAPAANATLSARNPAPQEAPSGTIDGPLDPTSFEGELIVAVPSGREIIVHVEKGEAPELIEQVRSEDAAGISPTRGRILQARAGCGEKVRSVAGQFGWMTSVQGCAVAGCPGYQREYAWSKTSDTGLCTKGKGFNSTNTATWYSTACSGGNWSVPWGNVLAYTQMQGLSTAGVVGATYDWRA